MKFNNQLNGWLPFALAAVLLGNSKIHAATLTVTNLADSGLGTLRNEMAAAAPGDTITFANTLSGQTIVLTSGQITLSQNVTIDASSLSAGITVSGNNASRIFLVNVGVVAVFKDLAITDGNGAGPAPNANYGGAIYNQGNLSLINCLVSSNQGFAGGSIYNSTPPCCGGILALNACTLAGNSASFGGAVQNEGMLAAVNSTFNANTGTNQGGAISAPFGAPTTVTQCTLTGNTAGDGGGTYGSGGSYTGAIYLTNSIVAGNSATNNANVSGGFTSGGNNLTSGNPMLAPLGNYGGPTPTMPPLTGSPAIDAGNDSLTSFLATDQRGFPRIIGPHVDIGAVEYFSVPFVTTTNDAGGGSLRDAAVEATNGATVTFTNTLSGQTIVLTGGQITISHNLTIDASSLSMGISVSGNHSSGIFEVSAGATVTLASLTLTNGFANDGGAILVDSNGTLTLNNSTLSGNYGNYGGGSSSYGTLTINNSTLSGNSSHYYGGGISSEGTLTVSNSTLSSNLVSGTGGVGGGIYFSGGTLTINSSTLSNNSAIFEGGGVKIAIGTATLTFTNSTLSGNSAGYAGGGIAMASGTTLTFNDSTLSSNTASNYGGGVFNNAGTLTINDSTVSSNSATTNDGGGIWNEGTLMLNHCTLSSNSAPNGSGGGILNNVLMLTITNCTLSGNSAGLGGGGIDNVDGGTSTVNNSTLSSNTVTSGGVGGAIYNAPYGTFTVNSCILSGNSTLGSSKSVTGGGILNTGTFTLNSSTLSGNFSGGAGGAVGNLQGILTVNNSTLSNNTANTDDGGGIYDYGYNNGATNTVNNCTITGNSAFGYGGGIANDVNSVLTVSNSTLSTNTAGYGGGIVNANTLTVNNSTLAGNSATANSIGGGGGIWNQGLGTLNNCTFSGNSAPNGYGGGINNDAGPLFSTNTIVAGNNALTYPDLYNSTNASFSGSDNLTNGMPLLAPLGNYGGPTPTMPPLSGSPAIDAGTDAVTNLLATDQRGFPRLSGAHVDIGAAEVQFVAVPTNRPVLKNVLRASAGGTNSLQFSFTNLPSADFTALASTNVSLPLSNWTVLGNVQEISPGQYQFTDSGTNNFTKRFYVVVSP